MIDYSETQMFGSRDLFNRKSFITYGIVTVLISLSDLKEIHISCTVSDILSLISRNLMRYSNCVSILHTF